VSWVPSATLAAIVNGRLRLAVFRSIAIFRLGASPLALTHRGAALVGGFGDTTHPAFRVKPQALRFRAPAPPAFARGSRRRHSLPIRPSHATRFARGFHPRGWSVRTSGRVSGGGGVSQVFGLALSGRHRLTIHSSRSRFAARLNSGVRAHMRVLQRLARIEFVALLSLGVAAALVAAYSAFQSIMAPSSMFSAAGSAQLAFFGTLLFGFLPVSLLGAPAYTWLSHRGWTKWWAVALLGAWPGAVAFFLDRELGFLSLLCGLTVAGLTHAVCRRWASPNNSFKPKPLRGSA
jgi:hypothetical protein